MPREHTAMPLTSELNVAAFRRGPLGLLAKRCLKICLSATALAVDRPVYGLFCCLRTFARLRAAAIQVDVAVIAFIHVHAAAWCLAPFGIAQAEPVS